jgi:hypothetical protein
MKERPQKVEIRTSHKSKKETLLKTQVNPCPAATKKEKEDRGKCLDRAFELLTDRSNQALNDDCQHFGNVIAAKLRTYNDTLRCAIQNDIMRIFVNANSVFYDRYHHTLLQPFNPPQAHFLVGQSISPPPHTSPSSLCSQNPSPSYSGNTSPSPFSPSPHTFSTESISPATASSEEIINVQVAYLLIEAFM